MYFCGVFLTLIIIVMYNKYSFLGILVTATLLMAACSGGKPNYKVSLKSDFDSASYYFGFYLGATLANSGIEGVDDINFNALAKGIKEGISNYTDEEKHMELNMFLSSYLPKLQERANERLLKEGQDFLEANKKKSGIVTLPSGLQYKIIREGDGIKPTSQDDVEVVYHGTLIDGTVFDSSKDRGDTTKFNVSRVVPGFSEALTLMSEGSIWEVYIPSELGYGSQPRPGGLIKPNSVLIFEIDMVKVIKNEPEPEVE